MKITTQFCKAQICKKLFEEGHSGPILNQKNWKRLHKRGSKDNIIRTFENSVTGHLMVVNSSDDKIFYIGEGTPKIDISLKEFLCKVYEESGKEEGIYSMGDHLALWSAKGWPQVPEDPDTPEVLEDLNMENFEWVEITDETILVCCGGDWQEPLYVKLKLNGGRFEVIDSYSGYDEGMDEEEFLKAIGYVENKIKKIK